MIQSIVSRYQFLKNQDIKYRNKNLLQYLCLELNIELNGKLVLKHEVTPLKNDNIQSIKPKLKDQLNMTSVFEKQNDFLSNYEYQTQKLDDL